MEAETKVETIDYNPSSCTTCGGGMSFWIILMTFAFVVWVISIVFSVIWVNTSQSSQNSSAFTVSRKMRSNEKMDASGVFSQVAARRKVPVVQDGASGPYFQAWLNGVGPSESDVNQTTPQGMEERGLKLFADADQARNLESQYTLPDVNIHGKDVRELMEAIVDRPDAERGKLFALDRSRDVWRGNFGPCPEMMDFFWKGPFSKYMKGLEFYPVNNYDYETGKADLIFGTEPNEASMG